VSDELATQLAERVDRGGFQARHFGEVGAEKGPTCRTRLDEARGAPPRAKRVFWEALDDTGVGKLAAPDREDAVGTIVEAVRWITAGVIASEPAVVHDDQKGRGRGAG
jgi:hypothetical protein